MTSLGPSTTLRNDGARTQCNRSSPDQDSCLFSSSACAFTCSVLQDRYAGCAAGIACADRYVDDVGAPTAWPRPSRSFLVMSVQAEGHKGPHIPYFSALSRRIYHLKISLLTSSASSVMAKSQALQSNLDVDYVISYRFAKTGMSEL